MRLNPVGTAPSLQGLAFFFAASSLAVACSPPRIILPPEASTPADTSAPEDSGVTPMDSGVVDSGRRDSGMDAAQDVATNCDPDRCFDDCVAMGGVTGRCMMNVCSCRFLDGGAPPAGDSGRDGSALVDVVRESSVRGCMSNAECPPTMFCSSTMCTGPGQCLLRQEIDPNRCMPDPEPSCGCDGLLYPSACARSAVGVRQDPARMCNGDAAVLPRADAATDATAPRG
jgi:hypothetical protein